jgi:superfamily I DNA/RNA helicase
MTPISLTSVQPETFAASTSGGVRPTDEQQAAIDTFAGGRPLVLEAGAGTGKTSTLRLMAASRPGSRGICLMYNRAAADQAKATFPRGTRCATAHSLAYQAVGRDYRDRLNGPRVPAWKAADTIGANSIQSGPSTRIGKNAVARLALQTVSRFCNSADRVIQPVHVPWIDGVDRDHLDNVRDELVSLATVAWHELQGRTGVLKFTHDTYLKLWQLSEPRLAADYVMLDEAQDAYPAILDVVLKQSHAQLVAVGDQQQAIYSYKGSMDAMRDWPAQDRLQLSQSFRFGPEIASEANVYLKMLGAPLRLRGLESIPSRLARLDEPAAVLCRTNAQAVAEAMAALDAGVRVAIVGGVEQVRSMARAANELKQGRATDHPELCAFGSWLEVQEYVEEHEDASDLRVLVQLVDRYGVGGIFRVTDAVVDEPLAQLIVSTAHKAKGREFESVLIARDFHPPKEGERLERSEVQLMYVSVTRAKRLLDCSALDWVRGWSVAR